MNFNEYVLDFGILFPNREILNNKKIAKAFLIISLLRDILDVIDYSL